MFRLKASKLRAFSGFQYLTVRNFDIIYGQTHNRNVQFCECNCVEVGRMMEEKIEFWIFLSFFDKTFSFLSAIDDHRVGNLSMREKNYSSETEK